MEVYIKVFLCIALAGLVRCYTIEDFKRYLMNGDETNFDINDFTSKVINDIDELEKAKLDKAEVNKVELDEVEPEKDALGIVELDKAELDISSTNLLNEEIKNTEETDFNDASNDFNDAANKKRCIFKTGDGTGGKETYIGVRSVEQCVNICLEKMKTNSNINGVTVSNDNAKKCYCKERMSGLNGIAKWKTCDFFAACPFKTGDGIGGKETYVGIKSPAECINICLEKKKTNAYINGVTVSNSNNNLCYCEEKMVGRNALSRWKSCQFKTENIEASDPDRFVGQDLQIGFGEDCYLFWRGGGQRLNAEFRCGKDKGDTIQIKKSGTKGIYFIKSSDKGLYWNGDEGNTKNAEFRRNTRGDKFAIEYRGNGMYAIYVKGGTMCPLYWLGEKGNVKNAEFRCNEPLYNFWIRGSSCRLSKLEILPTSDKAIADGEEIVGITSSGSCQKLNGQLSLSRTREVTEEVGLEISESNEVNWEASLSVSVMAGANIFGVKTEVTVTAGLAVGGAKTYGSSKTTSTSDSTSVGAGQNVNWEGPGGAMIVGLVKKYKFNKADLPAKATVICKGGYSYQYDTSIKLKTQRYGHVFFKPFTGTYKSGTCTHNSVNCLFNTQFRSYKSVYEAQTQFMKCFPHGGKK